MSKTLYYRETDSSTGKAKWIKLEGVKGNNYMIFIETEESYNSKQTWEEFHSNADWIIVYKSTSTKVRK